MTASGISDFPPIDDAWFLTGPTASGKTSVGVSLARTIGAEIVSLDSMAVYRGMDIGTAKPTEAERMGVPHHLIDLVEPSEDFSVAEYLTAAHACAAEIRSRGREVLFVGGTPLYLKALLRGLTSGPEADAELRQRLQAEADESGPQPLHARLAEIDPGAAAKIHPHDARRIIRALEVYEATGQPISASQEHFQNASQAATKRVFVLDWPRATLHLRINARVDAMFAAGLIDEVRRLRKTAGGFGRTAAQAVGYREVQCYLNGECDLSTAIERTKARTRQFARRQLIWFRALPECRWVPMGDPLDAGRVAREML
jgi:tRNA dimethylallyltransferase